MKIYKIDPIHSYVGFKVKHMMITNVNGSFKKFDAKVISNSDDFCDGQIDFLCEVDSITTNIHDRDEHLKSADFFNSEVYPTITFKSTNIENMGGEKYKVIGDLTIKDRTLPVDLVGEYNGNIVDDYGNLKHGFELFGSINRTDFNLTCNALNGKSNMLIGEEVKLIINITIIENT